MRVLLGAFRSCLKSLFTAKAQRHRGLIFVLALLALAACGGSGYTQTAQTASYSVQLTLDGTDFNEHTATVEVHDQAKQPVENAQVVVTPIMEAMGMAAPEQTAQPLGAGRYQVKGEFFSMIGEWEFDVRVASGGNEEVARFKVPVQE
jgi:hypothetical protein